MTRLLLILSFAFLVRAGVAVLGWSGHYVKSPAESITVTYQRSAYLHAWGYGYAQTVPGSPAYKALMGKIDSVNHFLPILSTKIQREGIYLTQHYPPGWSILGSYLYTFTRLPVQYLMQFVGIILDILAILFLYKLSLLLLSSFLAQIAAIIYAFYPPIVYGSIALTPDSFLLFILIAISYFFFKSIKGERLEKISINSFIIIGLLNGFGALFRSDYLLYPGFISLLFLFLFPFKKAAIQVLKFNMIVGGVTFLILLPWGLRNYYSVGNFSITSTALGGTLVTGLGAFPNPWNLGPSDIDRVNEAKKVGIDTPFEADGDRYFRNQFGKYVKSDPGYYLKSLTFRSAYFICTPYFWGNKKPPKRIRFSELRSSGTVLKNIPYILKNYWTEMISVFLSLLCFVFLIYLIVKKKGEILTAFLAINYLHVFITHIPIHAAVNYVYPLVFCQVIILVYLLNTLILRK